MKPVIVSAFLAAAAFAAPASAQVMQLSDTVLNFNLDADVSQICGVYNELGAANLNVAFGDLSTLAQGSTRSSTARKVVYRCNSTAGFTRTIASQNGGYLKRVGTDNLGYNEISYRVSHTGGADLQLGRGAPVPLLSPDTKSVNASHTYLTGVVADVQFTAYGVFNNRSGESFGAPGTTVFAGDYTDVVSITVTAR